MYLDPSTMKYEKKFNKHIFQSYMNKIDMKDTKVTLIELMKEFKFQVNNSKKKTKGENSNNFN